MSPRHILITGGCGRIGLLLAHGLAGQWSGQRPPLLTLLDRLPPPAEVRWPYVQADVAQFAQVRPQFDGYDTIVHLAADPRPAAPWESLLPNNIIGTYNVLQAANEAGCQRVILASSLYAVLGYPPGLIVHADMPPRPANLYGVTKVWAEALGYCYAQQGLSVLCVRIGWLKGPASVAPGDADLDLVITPRDLTQLLACCIAAPADLHYGVFHGLSANRVRRFDISAAQALLGYQPQDDAYALARSNYGLLLRRWAGRIKRCLLKCPTGGRP